jgi:predicted flap endonuclease-1-like 5' DNA nuclease
VGDPLPRVGAPATRALAAVGITRLSQLADLSEQELLEMHGVGPRAVRIVREALAARGESLRGESSGT